uniref:CDP-diacylglycerol--glycerol-3-phosphate 3-phosphatidyltransferase n=1 Tax=Moniliophthora roreri TaxID=221103 RepID=A0A0W0F713_MONRR
MSMFGSWLLVPSLSLSQANGFYGSKGISGRIPEGYTLLEQRFMKAVARAGRFWKESTGVQLLEWLKDGWTYHAKGLWFSPNASSHPVLTLFGSTNLNSRSSHIDTELSFVMILPSEQQNTDSQQKATESANGITILQAQLADEVANIRANAHEWKGDKRKHSVEIITNHAHMSTTSRIFRNGEDVTQDLEFASSLKFRSNVQRLTLLSASKYQYVLNRITHAFIERDGELDEYLDSFDNSAQDIPKILIKEYPDLIVALRTPGVPWNRSWSFHGHSQISADERGRGREVVIDGELVVAIVDVLNG